MKKTYILLVGILISILCGSCNSEETTSELPDSNQSLFYIYSSITDLDVRTVMDASGAIRWVTTDRINVNGVTNTETDIAWNGGTGTRFGFATKPTPEDGNYYAVYPAVAADGTNSVYQKDGKFKVKMPQEQPYKDKVSFGDKVNLSAASGDTNQLLFYNVCGVVKLTLLSAGFDDFDGIKKIRFVSNPGKPVSGTGIVDAFTKTLALDAGQSETVDVVFNTPQSFTDANPLSILWCIPVNLYEAGWKIQILNESNILLAETTGKGALNVQRNKITNLNTVRVEKRSYKIQFAGMGIDNAFIYNSTQNKLVGVDTKILAASNTRPAYVFLGWALTPNAITPQFRAGDSVNDVQLGYAGSDVTLYPVWQVSFFDCRENGLSLTSLDSGDRRAARIYVSGSGNSAKLMLTGEANYSAALFQYGSVIAWNYGDTGDAVYNPSISGSSVWDSNWSYSEVGITNTIDGLKAGKGDPCRLVGMTVSEIQAALNAGKIPDNGLWRLPADYEYRSYSDTFRKEIYGIKGYHVGPRGDTYFYPYVGFRRPDGIYRDQGSQGNYWGSNNTVAGEGFALRLSDFSIGSGFEYQTYGYSVRCIRQTERVQ